MWRETSTTSLGEHLDGRRGRRDAPEGYIEDLVDFTFWVLAKRRPTQKLKQILLGRWARMMRLRRAMCCLFTAAWRGMASAVAEGAPPKVVDEFLSAMALLPLCYQGVRYKVAACVTASDASITMFDCVGSTRGPSWPP